VYLAAVGDFLDALLDAVDVSCEDSGPAAVDSHVVVGFLVHCLLHEFRVQVGVNTASSSVHLHVHNSVTSLRSSSVQLAPTARCRRLPLRPRMTSPT